MDTKASPLEFLASFVLQERILDWFDVVKAEEQSVNPSKKDKYQAELHLYLDERGNRAVADVFLSLSQRLYKDMQKMKQYAYK